MEQHDSEFTDSRWVEHLKEDALQRGREIAIWVALAFFVLVFLMVFGVLS